MDDTPSSDTVIDGLRKLSVGRIMYLVIAAVPVAVLFRLLLDHGVTKDERTSDFYQSMLMLIVDTPVVIAGLAILITNKIKNRPLNFWIIAVLFASLPILFGIGAMLLESVANIHIQPFT